MLTQSNQFLAFPPILYKKPYLKLQLFPVRFEFRYFHGAKLAHRTKISVTESTHSPSSLLATRVSRVARTEAQGVLFDYLHCTRNLSFTDAEHISKNSPNFVQVLLSKIHCEKDVTRSLAKFLRYNPLNEFEPFFESLGLSPSEVTALLPRDLMFLTDDSVMLENYHALCNYGIPRANIGKMYNEAGEIFRYDYGVLALKLEAYESLGLAKATVIKLVTCCPFLLVGGVNGNFVLVLDKLRRLGMKNDWIGGYLTPKRTYNWCRILDTIDFLDKVGYSEDRLGNLLRTNPELVFEGSGKMVSVLFGRLLKLGLKMNEVYSLFMKNPEILSSKCIKNLFEALNFLFYIGMGTEDIAKVVSSNIELMGSSSLKGPRTVCKDLKVTKDGLCQIIKEEPLKLFSLASKSKVRRKEHITSLDSTKHMEKTAFLLRLGYVENSDEMMKALKQFRGRGDQLQERFDCLINAGLDCNVVTSIIKQAPMVLNQSKDVIEKKIDCLRNCLGYPLESIVAFPAYLCYDIERINHRFAMYVWLRKRGAAKTMLSLSTILACSDARFVKYFVNVHPEGPAYWANLRKSSTSS
ncbi:transcription termination factor MTEF18, mitochondrial [Carica papaya]|uniref:transcription termination factor MTEF18, mitochondrial n=1 Tax=Carica papaya TaxID=3649 RepID=UPI000B8CF819|nr:transcription termination factor MTEF18, mitochondrial [Carica papaya]